MKAFGLHLLILFYINWKKEREEAEEVAEG